ncbi:MAG TPA: hypothetical protein VH298_03295 [Jatrophihabitans sp.]|nr:hypothetical protein [Jatrophihabitans sp.]
MIGIGATVLAMSASGQSAAVRAMLRLDAHRLELTTLAVAVAEYAAYRASLSLLIWLSLPVAVGIQRYFMSKELRTRIADTAPMDRDTWLHVAKVLVAASDTIIVLRIDTADRLSAQTVARLQCGCDAIGTYSDGGLAVLLLDCPPPQGDALARRFRTAMDLHKVECNIASASKPRDGRVLADLLAVSEAELVLSKEIARRPTDSA